MQCPACQHEAPQEDFGNPLQCPECCCYYEKAIKAQLAKQSALLNSAQPKKHIPANCMECVSCGTVIKQSARICPKCARRYDPPKKTRIWWWLLGIFVGLPVLVSLIDPPEPSQSAKAPAKAPAEKQEVYTPPPQSLEKTDPAKAALENVRLEFKWGKKHDTLMVANFTVINDGYSPIKDIEIKCVHSGASGSRIDSNTRTIYDVVPQRSRKSFNGFDMGFIHSQAVKSQCSIVSIKI